MADEDIPHRVIYLHLGKLTTRVFANRTQADDFAAKQKGETTIQLASEKPNIPPSRSTMMQSAKRHERVKCHCGKGNRLPNENSCYMCAGEKTNDNQFSEFKLAEIKAELKENNEAIDALKSHGYDLERKRTGLLNQIILADKPECSDPQERK